MTPPQLIGAMSSSRVILGGLLSSRARLRFPGHPQAQPSTPVRQANPSERHTGLFQSVSSKGFTPIIRYNPDRLTHSSFQKRLIQSLIEIQKGEDESFSSVFSEENRAETKPDELTEPVALLQQAQAAFNESRFDDARGLLHKASTLFEAKDDAAGKGTALRILGIVYVHTGDYLAAQRAFEQSLEALKDANDPRGESVAYGNLAFIFEATADFQRAEEFHRRALAISESLGDREDVASHLANLAYERRSKNRPQSAA